MYAAYITEPGLAENLLYGELPQPVATGSQVLVKVGAVSVNPIDTYIRAGVIKMQVPLPYIVGCDLAGTVVAVGPEAKRFQVGDRVWGTNQGLFGRQGTFAEFAAVDEQWLYPIPDGVTEESAAAAALVAVTAAIGLNFRAKLKAGETIFVSGGSGGVGSTVIQMAKAIGATVITSAGSEAKAKFCKDLGADAVILYKQELLPEVLKRIAPDGVDVWWEVAREPNFEVAVPLMKFRGRFVLMAGRDARPVFPVGPFYTRDLALHGFAMFNAPPAEQRQASEQINQLLVSGALKPPIDRVLPLSQAAEAHKLQEQNTLQGTGCLSGKLVLKP